MPTKCTWLFNGRIGTPGRPFGFSETWYTGLTGDAILTAMDFVSDRRVLTLARYTNIVGYRIGQPNGRAFVVPRDYAAPSTNSAANVQLDSALMQCGNDLNNAIKRFYLHCLPDAWVDDGDVSVANQNRLRLVIDTLSVQGFQFRSRKATSPVADILEVSAAGVVKTIQNMVVAVKDEITFLRARDVNGKAVRGTYIVTAVASATEFTLAHWPNLTLGRSGKVKKLEYEYGGVISLGQRGFIRTGGRKVGRPFGLLRGRAPTRR